MRFRPLRRAIFRALALALGMAALAQPFLAPPLFAQQTGAQQAGFNPALPLVHADNGLNSEAAQKAH